MEPPEGKTPRRPTSFLPGTIGKQLVMRQRVARGELPCHPADAPMDVDGIVRVPILSGNSDFLGWEIRDEREFLAWLRQQEESEDGLGED